MNPRKILLIAKREFTFNFRRRGFLVTAFLIPLITFGALGIVFGVLQNTLSDTNGFKAIGIVDQSGTVFVNQSGATGIDIPAPFKLVTENAAKIGMADKSLDGYYLLSPTFLADGSADIYNRPDLAFNDGLNQKFDTLLKSALAAQVGNPAVATRLEAPLAKVVIRKIGDPQELDESALLGAFFVPFIFAMLIYISVMTTSQFLLSGVVEEKENRMMELFATSSRPIEMLWGKILGLGLLGLTQLLIWGVIGFLLSLLRGPVNIAQTLADLQITPGYFVILLMYFLLGYLLYGAVMAGLGATVNVEQEGRQLSSLISIVFMIPLFFFINVLSDPNGGLAVFFSLFPLTAPIGMILRASATTIPTIQIILGILLLAVSSAVVILFSAWLFRIGMLNYGKRLSVRDIFRALRQNRASSRSVRQQGVAL